jgi:hypothetical protein
MDNRKYYQERDALESEVEQYIMLLQNAERTLSKATGDAADRCLRLQEIWKNQHAFAVRMLQIFIEANPR